MKVAIEATPSRYWLYDCLEYEGFKVSRAPSHRGAQG